MSSHIALLKVLIKVTVLPGQYHTVTAMNCRAQERCIRCILRKFKLNELEVLWNNVYWHKTIKPPSKKNPDINK